MKKPIISILIAIAVVAAGIYFFGINNAPAGNTLTFYYLKSCSHCKQVEDEGTLEKIEKLGIKVKKVDVNIGPIRDNIKQSDGNIYTPTFVIDGKVYVGYRSYDDLVKLIPPSWIKNEK